ncbi:MAG: GNAT family N-acetyltransferase, partial [Gemmatimonadaceae bacterium]
QLLSPEQLRPAEPPGDGYDLREEAPCAVARYRALYDEVGRAYHWRDRTRWSDEELATYLARGDVSVWVLRHAGRPAGFFELARHEDRSVEIAYFGLVQRFHGKGLGKFLLTRACEQAWQLEATRVWLHTCTLDGAAAMPNCLARGLVPYRTEQLQEELPNAPPLPG